MCKAGQLRYVRAQLLLFSLFKPHEHSAAAACVQNILSTTLLKVWGSVGAALHAAASMGWFLLSQSELLTVLRCCLKLQGQLGRNIVIVAKHKCARLGTRPSESNRIPGLTAVPKTRNKSTITSHSMHLPLAFTPTTYLWRVRPMCGHLSPLEPLHYPEF